MDRDVLVHINGMQFAHQGDETNPVEIIRAGEYFFKNNTHYLVYDDIDEETEERSQNFLKFRDDYLEIVKNGTVNTKMVFEKDKRTFSQYRTRFGSLNIGISTTDIELKPENADEMELTVKYALDVNETYMADCNVDIIVRSKSEGINLSS